MRRAVTAPHREAQGFEKSVVNNEGGLGAFARRLGTPANATVDGREQLWTFVNREAGVDDAAGERRKDAAARKASGEQ